MRVKKVYVDPMLYITGKIPVREISLSPINSKSESLWTKIKKEAKQMIEAGIDFTNDVISSVQKDIDDFYDWLKQTGNAGIKELNDDLKIAWGEYQNIKQKMVEKAKEISKYVIEKAKDALKFGGYIVAYTPYVDQVKLCTRILKKRNFSNLKSLECILREMEVKDKGIRPKTRMTGHTGYLTFGRKLK